jgi:tryptophan-rich sensory protein
MNYAPAKKLRAIAVAAAAAVAVATLGALVTDLGPWYFALRKPSWQPPDWLFGPAWTLIFACAAWAGYRAWMAAPDRTNRRWIATFFGINALLNVAWSLLFFRLQRPDWALVEVFLLWLSIALLIVLLWRFSEAAAWLLVPYLASVTFAGLLNFTVVRLNHPF